MGTILNSDTSSGAPPSTARFALGAGFLLPWSPTQGLFQHRQKRLVCQGTGRYAVCTEELYVLVSEHPGKEGSPVRGEFEQGTDLDQSVVPTAHVGGSATPAITAWHLFAETAFGHPL